MKRIRSLPESRLVASTAPLLLGIGAFAAFLLAAQAWVGLIPAGLALALASSRSDTTMRPESQVSTGIVIMALSMGVTATVPAAAWPTAVSGGGLILIIGVERLLLAAIATGHLESANLGVDRSLPDRMFRPGPVQRAIRLANVFFAVASAATILGRISIPMWLSSACTATLVAGLAAGAIGAWLKRRSSSHPGDNAVLRAISVTGPPQFIVHFSGPPQSAYQLRMWLQHLDQTGIPYFIVCRESTHLPDLRDHTQAPIVVAPTISTVEHLLVDGVKAVFYVNNAALNTQLLRFERLTHVQLMHGESDKASSFNRVTAIYDRVFVAGRAAIDRYRRHGIDIPDHRFSTVGRPQLGSVKVGHRNDSADAGATTMLYAPTWAGLSSDFNYSSLPIGKRIVAEALRRGLTVWLRPHPYSRRNVASARQLAEIEELLRVDHLRSGRCHRWGDATTVEASLVDCINAADVAVTDVSAVATDWLYADRPFAICDIGRVGEEAFADKYWIARGAYRIPGDATRLDEVFDEMLETDSRAQERDETRRYFLGDGTAVETEDRFGTAVRECLSKQSHRMPVNISVGSVEPS